MVERFGRALVAGHAFALDDGNRDKVLAHLAAGNPQEGEDKEFATALFDAVRAKTVPVDASKGLRLPAARGLGGLAEEPARRAATSKEPLDDLEAAYTNEFVEAWNKA